MKLTLPATGAGLHLVHDAALAGGRFGSLQIFAQGQKISDSTGAKGPLLTAFKVEVDHTGKIEMKCVRNGGTVTALAFISVLPASLDLCAKNWLLAGPYVFEKALRGERAIKEMIESMNGQGVPHKGQFALQVELNEGWNEILVKIAGGSTGSGFWMAVSEFDGVEISAH